MRYAPPQVPELARMTMDDFASLRPKREGRRRQPRGPAKREQYLPKRATGNSAPETVDLEHLTTPSYTVL